MRTDWLGKDYDVGDLIIYPSSMGHTPTMVIAKVLGFTAKGGVSVMPISDSRYGDRHGDTKYLDTRTGDFVSPWRDQQHIAYPSHYIDKRNGREIPDRDLKLYDGRQINHNYVAVEFRERVRAQFQSWIEIVRDIRPVTISVTVNITKWEGDLPDALTP